MRRKTDKRTIRTVENPALLKRTATRIRRYQALQLDLAKDFAEIESGKSYRPENAESLGEWVARHGLDRGDAYRLLRVGRAVEQHALLEQKIKQGALPLANVAQLGRVVGKGAQQEPTEEPTEERTGEPKRTTEPETVAGLLDLAERESPESFRDTVDAEVESRAGGTARRERISVHTSRDGAKAFRRACELASRMAQRVLTPGQAFDLINADFLKRRAPEQSAKGTRTRKIGKTSGDPSDRRIPAQVEAALRKRSEDRCEMPGCGRRIFLDRSHACVANADGGGQEEWELALLCSGHHTQFDKGTLMLRGWTPEGRPVFRNRRGEVFLPADLGKPRKRVPRGAVRKEHPARHAGQGHPARPGGP